MRPAADLHVRLLEVLARSARARQAAQQAVMRSAAARGRLPAVPPAGASATGRGLTPGTSTTPSTAVFTGSGRRRAETEQAQTDQQVELFQRRGVWSGARAHLGGRSDVSIPPSRFAELSRETSRAVTAAHAEDALVRAETALTAAQGALAQAQRAEQAAARSTQLARRAVADAAAARALAE